MNGYGRTSGFCIGVALLLSSSGYGSAQQYRPIDEVIAEGIAQVALRTKAAVDPAYAQEMNQSAMLFASNFCLGANEAPHENCLRTIYEPAVLAEEVQLHLDDIGAGTSTVLSLGARLAIRVGDSITRAGWPERIENQVAKVTFDGRRRVGLIQDGMVFDLGNPLVAHVLPGNHHFQFDDGSEAMVNLDPRESVDLQSASGSHQTASVGRLTPAFDRICRLSSEIDFRDDILAPFNWGRAQIPESDVERASNLAPILHDRVVSIKIIDHFERCSSDCRAAVATAFARAILTWRAGCDRCDPGALAAVRVGSDVWLDTRLMDRLRDGQQVELSADDPATNVRFAGLPAIYPLQSRLVHFDHLSGDKSLLDRLCSGDVEGDWVLAARDEICGETAADDFHVTLLGPGEFCDNDEDLLACAEPGGGVRVALDSVALSAKGTYLAGSIEGFTIDVIDLAIHEVGHWFGVPHSDIAEQEAALDIMSATYDGDRLCIGGASAVMMISAADIRWPHRLGQCAGWRKPMERKHVSGQ